MYAMSYNSWSDLTETHRQLRRIYQYLGRSKIYLLIYLLLHGGDIWKDTIYNVLNIISKANAKMNSLREFFTLSLQAENMNTKM